MQKKQITKKNAKKCEKNATQPEQQKQKAKKKKKRDSPLNRLEAPQKIAALLSPRQNFSLSKIFPLAKFVLKQNLSLSKNFPLAKFFL